MEGKRERERKGEREGRKKYENDAGRKGERERCHKTNVCDCREGDKRGRGAGATDRQSNVGPLRATLQMVLVAFCRPLTKHDREIVSNVIERR